MRPAILLQSGNYFDFVNPSTDSFTLEDIAQGLANTCRFGGHCHPYYSVAQHCILASHYVPQEHAMAALLHDAAEAFVGDIPSPLKQMLTDFEQFESLAHAAVAQKFKIPEQMHPCIKEVDLRMLATEKRDVMPKTDMDWTILSGIEPFKEQIVPMSQRDAKIGFLVRYVEIKASNRRSALS